MNIPTQINLTDLLTLRNTIYMGAGSALLAILTGKTLRRLLLLPFKLLAQKSQNKEEILIVEEAARDLGLPSDAAPTLPPTDNTQGK